MMLMPYYIAALNIEHAYLELTGQYERFERLCFVDTLDIPQRPNGLSSRRRTQPIEREREAKITVIIGNRVQRGQLNENDNNKTEVPEIDDGIHDTYARAPGHERQ